MESTNQNPEQVARDLIDKMLVNAGWIVQSKDNLDIYAANGVAVREYGTDIGPADYILFVDAKPVGVIEAKKEDEGQHLRQHEQQAEDYAKSKLKHLDNRPLPFVYTSTGAVTLFTDHRDPKPKSREVFSFHRPGTIEAWLKDGASLRERLTHIPELDPEGLRPAQITAITNLEKSFGENHPRALIQMATGAGKTFTACTFVYRLLKFAKAKRILFLVDTRNLGEQAEQEFLKFQPRDDNRKFTELYNVQRLSSSYIAKDSQVCISTIQRLYSILKGEELDEALEEENPNEKGWQKKEPMPVEYTQVNPIEQFDFIVIDECHRSIYNLWKQVLDYYDAFLIGLTATPDKRTFGFFNENVVSEYTYEESVTDGVNVPYDVYTIETQIGTHGETIRAEEYVDKREKLTRKKRWERMDEDTTYSKNQLDKDFVNPSQIRNVIRAFRDALKTKIFPDRVDEHGEYEIPKTLIFAKTDSHADDIITAVLEEFSEGNDFCKKVTYKIDEDPKSVLNRFRNSWNPRIAVTVDMIATGTDVKPLEILLFMRDVKSVGYFEQMKGRGTRSINFDDLKRVTRTAKHTKTHFVIVDAIGATKSTKTDSRPLERKPAVALKDLLSAVAVGAQDEDLFTSLANRLIRMQKQLTDKELDTFTEMTGKSLNQSAKDLLNAYDPDEIDKQAQLIAAAIPQEQLTEEKHQEIRQQAQGALIRTAARTFTGKVNEYLDNVRRVHEQIIDIVNTDTVTRSEFDSYTVDKAKEVVEGFREYIEANKDEITALSIFYSQPYRRRELTFQMISDLLETVRVNKPLFAPSYIWDAYAQLEEVQGQKPESALVALVSLIRRVCGIDQKLTAFNNTVDKNFQEWVFRRQAGKVKFTEEQMQWLRLIKEHVCGSFHIEVGDLDYTPFDSLGGRGKMYQLFGNDMTGILDELNEALAV